MISPPSFRWIIRHLPKVYDQIALRTVSSDLINYKLTSIFATDPSSGSSSGLLDYRSEHSMMSSSSTVTVSKRYSLSFMSQEL
ncbi:hypothetical protein KEJ43_05485 [Candidatus Bathyarchaeota archaeon]|nr:hypothetical protein [Candidatus Bathyarchaeota archaeon]